MASGRQDYGGDKKLSNFAADMFTAWSEKSLISSLMQTAERDFFFTNFNCSCELLGFFANTGTCSQQLSWKLL